MHVKMETEDLAVAPGLEHRILRTLCELAFADSFVIRIHQSWKYDASAGTREQMQEEEDLVLNAVHASSCDQNRLNPRCQPV